jgi:hypothetical protein
MKVFKNMVIIVFQNTFTLKMHKNNFLFIFKNTKKILI